MRAPTEVSSAVPTASRAGLERDGLSYFDVFKSDYEALRAGMHDEDTWNFVNNTTESHLEYLSWWAPAFDRWVQNLPWPKGSVHLDIGAGMGAFSYLVARRGYHSVAIELDETNLAAGTALSAGVARNEKQSLQLWVANIYDIPLPDQSADFVTIKEVLHHLDLKPALFNELARILKPGGLVYIWEPFFVTRLAGPLRHFLLKRIRRRELSLGIHHIHHSWGEYKAAFRKASDRFTMRALYKRSKRRHHFTQNRLGLGRVEAVLSLKHNVPGPTPSRQQIKPGDFVREQYLQRSLEAGERFRTYLDNLGPTGVGELEFSPCTGLSTL